MTTAPTRRVSSGERINPADPSGHLQQALRQRGIRLTRQRRVILQVMDSAEQHLDVDQILQRAQQIDPDVHRYWHRLPDLCTIPTVYEDLETLFES